MEESQKFFDVPCSTKWFDPSRGFGFFCAATSEFDFLGDILIHRTDVADFEFHIFERSTVFFCDIIIFRNKARLVSINSMRRAEFDQKSFDENLMSVLNFSEELCVVDKFLRPARVNWYDPVKGYGFANAFSYPEDIFIHAETLRAFGVDSISPGSAVLLRRARSDKGMVSIEVQRWEYSFWRHGKMRCHNIL